MKSCFDRAIHGLLLLKDNALFLQTHKPPVIIVEVQYAPQLFSAIKIAVDRAKQPGMFWLTGSQKFYLNTGYYRNAGRQICYHWYAGAVSSWNQRSCQKCPAIPAHCSLAWECQGNDRRPSGSHGHISGDLAWIFPKTGLGGSRIEGYFFNSYVQTYIQRDVSALSRVGAEMAFNRLIRAAAARTAQLTNYADFAWDVDVDQKTVKAWLSILEASGLDRRSKFMTIWM